MIVLVLTHAYMQYDMNLLYIFVVVCSKLVTMQSRSYWLS